MFRISKHTLGIFILLWHMGVAVYTIRFIYGHSAFWLLLALMVAGVCLAISCENRKAYNMALWIQILSCALALVFFCLPFLGDL